MASVLLPSRIALRSPQAHTPDKLACLGRQIVQTSLSSTTHSSEFATTTIMTRPASDEKHGVILAEAKRCIELATDFRHVMVEVLNNHSRRNCNLSQLAHVLILGCFQIDIVLGQCVVTDDDPACLLAWNMDGVTHFVAAANAAVDRTPDPWVTTVPGSMTPTTFMNDVVGFLATVSGGRTGSVLLAPNDLSQYGNVLTILERVASSSYVQATAAALPVGSLLATIYQLQDRRVVKAVPANLVAPYNQAMRHIFV